MPQKKPRLQKKGRRSSSQPKRGTIRIGFPLTGYIDNKEGGASIEIPSYNLKTALHGDTVLYEVTGKGSEKQPLGKVIKIASRAKEQFVGELKKVGAHHFITPDDKKLYKDILIPHNFLDEGRVGEKVLVRLSEWKDSKNDPVGQVVKVLGKAGVHETEMEAILYDRGFVTGFPKEIDEEAEHARERLNDPKIEERRDFRDVPTFTIDPKTAKDFDDALSIQKLSDGTFEIGVHIADVTHFVVPGTKLDKEAARRATSIYLVDRTIPMLPEVLSNDLCSLNPNEEKLAYSAVFIMTKDGKVVEEWFGKTRIKSNKRFTYEEAQVILDAKKGIHYEELKQLNDIALALRKEKFAKGAIAFEDNEIEFELDKKMFPIAITKKERLDTHRLVEDFMLLANKHVALFIHDLEKKAHKKLPFVYRIHEPPNPEKIERILTLLKKLGHKVKITQPISSFDINAILKQVSKTPEEDLINTATIQSMAKAVYSMKNIGHFGLSFPYYTHFTSPIRRYPDVMVHRLLSHYLHNVTPKPAEVERYDELSTHSSTQEQTAEQAERESKKYKQVEYMSKQIGKVFEGTVSSVMKWGFFVKEKETLSEGLIPLRELYDDHYEYDEKTLSLVGKKTKRTFRLGDTVKIKVKETDIRKKQIDYTLVS